LGAVNVPQGSVKVSANGVQLTEGVDYTVDYMLGTVTIINEQVKQSGQAINIS
jgi:cell surface protein SprA